MKFRDAPAPRRSRDVVERDVEVETLAPVGSKPFEDAVAKGRAVGEHRLETRAGVTGGGKNRHPDGVEREHAATAATRLNLLPGGLHDRMNNFDRLSRARLDEVANRPIDPAGDFRFEIPHLPQNVHVSHFSSRPARRGRGDDFAGGRRRAARRRSRRSR